MQTNSLFTEINSLSNSLISSISKFVNELSEYQQHYNFNKHLLQSIPTPTTSKDPSELKKDIQTSETIFDKLQESLLRNELCLSLQNMIEKSMISFTHSIEQLKKELSNEKEELFVANNEILDNMVAMEMKMMKQKLRKIFNIEEKKTVRKSTRENIVKNISKFHQLSNKENMKKKEQIERVEQLKDIFTLEELQQIETVMQLQVDRIVYDSNWEQWEQIGNEGSLFQENMIGNETMIVLIESENNEKFGYSLSSRIDEIGKEIKDSNTFIFTYQNNELKYDLNPTDDHSFIICSKDHENLIEYGKDEIIIKKGDKRNESICKPNQCIDSYGKEIVLLNGNDNYFTPKRIVILEMKESEEMKSKKRKQRFEDEQKKLKELTEKTIDNPTEEIKQLEEMSFTLFKQIIFDSDINNWEKKTSSFDNCLLNKNHIAIIVETEEGIKFGGYVDTRIKDVNKYINDHRTFLFTFKDNKPIKYKIIDSYYGIVISSKGDNELFTFGYGDICVMKKDVSHFSTCKQSTFYEYHENENTLIGKTEFTVKHIQVIQFEQTEELKRKKYACKKKLIEQQKLKKEQEIKQLKERSEKYRNELPKELQMIEESIYLKYENVVFDTECCDWNIGSSTFDERILKRNNLMILIDISDTLKIGGFIFNSIESIGNYVEDRNAFIFKIEENEMKRYLIQQTSIQYAVIIYPKSKKKLMSFGWDDIKIMKESLKDQSSCEETTYEVNENDIFFDENKSTFIPQRIQVIQFKETDYTKEQRYKQLLKQVSDENRYLKELTPIVKQEQEKQIKQIEQWSQTKFDSLLFDSDCCNWSVGSSTFDKHIIGKEKLVFLIEDLEDNVIGGFVNSTIDSYFECDSEEYGDENIMRIVDPNAFIFKLKTNKDTQSKKFDIIPRKQDLAFSLSKQSSEYLFTFGNGDIEITKNNATDCCYTNQNSYEYESENEALISSGEFEIKHIQVWQMVETKEQKKIKEQQKQQLEMKRKSLYEKELNELKEKTNVIKEQQKDIIQQIEEWSQSKFSSIVFDSSFCNWNVNTSTFDKHIFGKDHLAFIIEDDEGNVFGGFINESINHYYKCNNWKMSGSSISDQHAFVFSMRSHGRFSEPIKFDIHSENRDKAFSLYDNINGKLFEFGQFDIYIMKENAKQRCRALQMTYNYQKYENSLVGNEGSFSLKRILVFEMIQTEEQKKEIQQKDSEVNQQIEIKINERFEKELILLQESSNDIYQMYEKQITQIEEWSKLKYDSILFDSDKCYYGVNYSTFSKHIFGKEKIAILIETKDYIKFGIVLYSPIDKEMQLNSKSEFDGIYDNHSFLFSFNKENSRKFDLKSHQIDKPIFYLCPNWDTTLFICGDSEIYIEKYGGISYSFQEHTSLFDYKTIDNALCGKVGVGNEIEITRILVLQLKGEIIFSPRILTPIKNSHSNSKLFSQTVHSQNKHTRGKSSNLSKSLAIEQIQVFTKDQQNLQNQTLDLPSILPDIEKVTKLSFESILFDSNNDNWKKDTSLFDSLLLKKDNLVIFIEIPNGITFGGFIKKKINGTQRRVMDVDTFLFSNRYGSFRKYPILNKHKTDAFELCTKQDKYLFIFGNDLFVYKEDFNGKSFVQERNCCFDYGRDKNALLGKLGEFVIHRLQVIQLN